MYTLSVRRPQPHNTNLKTERREREKEYKTIVGIEQLRPMKKHWASSRNPPVTSKTELSRLFQRDTEKGIKVLLYCKVLQ